MDSFMQQAIGLAVENVRAGRGGPFAALVVKDGEVVAYGTNLVTSVNDPTAHAEIVAIRRACEALGAFQLNGCDFYTTCEPCPMCLGAIYWARPRRVIYAATREDAAAAGFDDAFIYNEVPKLPEARSLPMMQVKSEMAHQPFETWRKFEGRIEY